MQTILREFGVIAIADLESRIKWHEDYISLLEEYDIGGAVWNYKKMDFEIYNEDRKPVSQELVIYWREEKLDY